MADGYIFGPKFDTGRGSKNGQYLQIGRVKSIVLGPIRPDGSADPNYSAPKDIGSITYEVLYSSLSNLKSSNAFPPAFPIWYFVKQYPLINEIVLIVAGPSSKLNDGSSKQEYYYMPAYGLWNNPNHNAFPNMQEWQEYLKQYSNQSGYSGESIDDKTLPLGYTFKENAEVKDLQPFEGDTIIQARFGQSIRFGSTISRMKKYNTWSNNLDGKDGDPITIIQNSQGNRIIREADKFNPIVEDINKGGSSIYLTSTQEINWVDLNNFPLKSFGTNITTATQNVVEVQKPPVSDEMISSQFQDENALK
jgi:hypothetical protein